MKLRARPEGIERLSRSLRKSHSSIISSQEYLVVREQLAFNLFPKGLVEAD